jgi:hypothetical protein
VRGSIAAVRRFFAGLPAAIYGRERKLIAKMPCVNFAILILWALMDPQADIFRAQENWQKGQAIMGVK